MQKRDLISIEDLSNREIEELFRLADCMLAGEREAKTCAGRIMATLFYEPSTRTRLSFESAMQRLGGSVISCSDMKSSSTAKGETVADTARVVASYADVLVVRHYWDGAVQAMAEYAGVPVINAGDGSHEHPTQTLCDLYTLRKEKGDLKGLTVVICRSQARQDHPFSGLCPGALRSPRGHAGGQRHGAAAVRDRKARKGISLQSGPGRLG